MIRRKTIDNLIKSKKPITIEKFIEISLYGENGYYNNSKVIGKEGDFITAPEITQLFGEIIGLFILSFWKKKINKPFNLVELGPGRGTLLLDILNITKSFPDFQNSFKINLIEKNYELIKQQKKTLNRLKLKNISWLNKFTFSKKKPVIIYANEFFDCLPIRQFYKKNKVWHEKKVIFDEKEKFFKWNDVKITNIKILNLIDKYQPKDILEISKSRENYFIKICNHIKNSGGMAIIIDYGYFERPNYFTLQSLINNTKSNILDNLGYQDITSLVDFKQLIILANSFNLNIDIFSTQREFFLKNGIKERADKVMKNATISQIEIIKNGFERLLDKDNMGSLFKVLVISK